MRRRWARTAGVTMVVAAIAMIVGPLAFLGYGSWQQRQLTRQWEDVVAEVPPAPTAPAAPADVTPTAAPADAAIVTPATDVPLAFALRVPKVGYYSVVVEGVGRSQLATTPGHYPTTPFPGHEGTVGVAAHNTYWLRFGELAPGDELITQTRYGTFKYLVTSTRIIKPDDMTVLDQATPGRHLVLTTCWPLWAGALADRRLAIFAEQRPAG